MRNIYPKNTNRIGFLKNRSLIFLLFILSSVFSLRLTAQNYIVNSNTDANAVNLVTGDAGGGVITLRSAIQAATAQPGAHIITFSGAVASPINLTLGQITVGNAANGNNITITGPGMNSLTVNQTTENRIFSTGTGAVTFLLQDITLNYTGPAVTAYSGGGGAIIAGGAGAATTLINCRITNFQRQLGNGGAISASSSLNNHSLTITNCIFTNNRAGGAGGAVSYNSQGGTAIITGCTFENNRTGVVGANTGGDGGAVSVTGGGSGGTYLIEKNYFLNNQVENVTGHAGAIMSTNGTATIRYNRFIGNTCANVAFLPLANIIGQAGGATTHVTIADNNWWGVNTGPGANDATALAAGAVMTLTKWLQLKATASPTPICPTNVFLGNTSTVTASFLTNSASEAIALANLSTVIGLPISFVNPTLGSLSAAQTSIQANGTATVLFTSNGTPGNGSVNAIVDNIPGNDATAKAAIFINTPASISVQPVNSVACLGSTALFTVTAAGVPSPTYQWRKGTTALINGPTGTGSTISDATTATMSILNASDADEATDYNVVVTNSCAIVTSNNASLTVNIPSVAPSGITGTTTICNGDQTTLTAIGGTLGTGANYQWGTGAVVGISPLAGETNSTLNVSPTSTTTYWVQIENTAAPCPANTGGPTQVVTVNQPSVAPSGIGGDKIICSGGNAFLEVEGGFKGTGSVTQWFTGSCGGTPAGTGDDITVSPTTTTTYYVRYSGICNTTGCAMVTVVVTPDNGISLTSQEGSDAQAVCSNTAINDVTYSTTGATGALFSGLPAGVNGSWLANEVTISGTPSAASGIFNYTVTLTGGCGNITANGSITVNPVPTVNAPSVTQPTCAVPAGNIVVNATGTGTLEYSINGGTDWFTTNTFSPGAGSYNIAVRSQTYPNCVVNYSGNPVVLTAATGCTVAPTFTVCPTVINLNTDAGVCTATLSRATLLSYVTASGTPVPTLTVKVGTTTVTTSYAFPIGNTTVTITASNGTLPDATCSFTITVTDNQPPVVNTIANPMVLLWSPNHKYQKINVSQFITSVSDNCGSIPVGNIVITKVTSDEAENAPGTVDGNTTQDIKIAANCKSVDLRSERMDGGNGRVYTIYFCVTDASGNTAVAIAKAIAAPNQSGTTAIDDGPVYTVNSNCNCGNVSTRVSPSQSANIIPESFVTVQNYPNPFSAQTTIYYVLPVNAQVNLSVYNSFGQKVAQLQEGNMMAGNHKASFDASKMAAGIYTYRLQIKDTQGKVFVLNGKMLFTK